MDSDTAPDLEDVPDLLEVDEPEPESESEAGPSRIFERPKIPVTLLTGYLGAGKSTLLEYVLTAEHGYKIAVCMNDFGDTTDIEAKSLTLSDPDTNSQTTSFLSLPNGCLCCSFKDMGIAAIEEMVASQKGVDWVMVELTGVADPGPIARSFWANEEMGDLILDGVVCVVDCRNVIKQLGESKSDSKEANDCQKQVACADVILLNKTDLVIPEHLQEVERSIRQANPTLRVHQTVQSRIPLESLFNIRAFSSDSTSLPLITSKSGDNTSQTLTESDPSHTHTHNHDQRQDQHTHDEDSKPHYNDITTIMIPLPTLSTSQYTLLERFLESLLWDQRLPSLPSASSPTSLAAQTGQTGPGTTEQAQDIEILRTKGYMKVENGEEYVVQGVTDMFEMKRVSQDRKSDDMDGKLVFIGRGVGPELKEAFNTFVGI